MTSLSSKVLDDKNCAIGKAADILKVFIPKNKELGTLQISRILGLHKATASRILLTLVRENFMTQNPETKKFKLGRNALIIGRSAIDALNTALVGLSKKHLDQLSESLNETVLLKKIIGRKSIILYVAKEQRAVRLIRNIGERIPAHISSGGRAILAFSKNPDYKVPNESFAQELKQIRERGYALNNEEGPLGITSVGVPVLDAAGVAVAAVVVTGPGGRLRVAADADIVDKIKRTATLIGEEMAAQGVEE